MRPGEAAVVFKENLAVRSSHALSSQALIDGCPSLSAISLLGAPHLSNAALAAIAENTNLDTFRLQGETFLPCAGLYMHVTIIDSLCFTSGNNRLTDVSWQALCRSSRGLRWLHVAECPRLTDASLKSFATLKDLEHLNVSLCSRLVSVAAASTIPLHVVTAHHVLG